MVVGWGGPRKLPGGEGPWQALESGQSDEKCGVGSCRYLDSVPNNTATALQGESWGQDRGGPSGGLFPAVSSLFS